MLLYTTRAVAHRLCSPSNSTYRTDELRQNNFTGTLPADIANWSNIVDFSVYKNSFSGTLPNGVEDWTSLLFLNLAQNNFHGNLPQVKTSLWPDILVADFYSNNFSGSLPEALEEWHQVIWARFNMNNFNGTVTFDACDDSNSKFQKDKFGTIFKRLQDSPSVKNHPSSPLLSALFASDQQIITVDCGEVQCTCCSTKCI